MIAWSQNPRRTETAGGQYTAGAMRSVDFDSRADHPFRAVIAQVGMWGGFLVFGRSGLLPSDRLLGDAEALAEHWARFEFCFWLGAWWIGVGWVFAFLHYYALPELARLRDSQYRSRQNRAPMQR